MSESISLEIPDDMIERIAQRAAEIVLRKIAARDEVEYLTVTEAAAVIGSGAQRIYDLRSSGRLKRYGDGRKALIKRSELEAYLDADR